MAAIAAELDPKRGQGKSRVPLPPAVSCARCWWPDISGHHKTDANAPFRHRCENWPDRRSVSTLNDVRWKWANRAARAGIVAHFYCLALLFLEPVQRKTGNVTQLPLVVS